MLNRLCALLIVAVGSGLGQVTVPGTPAGDTLQAWLNAFNSGDRAQIETYVKTVDQSQSVDGMFSFRNQTGGFELLSIESSEPLHIRFRVKEKAGSTTALGNFLINDGQPPTVATFGLRALPPGTVLENVTMDAAERRRVIDAVNIELKEYYVEPATPQQMANALKMHESKGDYDAISDGDAFAAELTKDLQDVATDALRCARGHTESASDRKLAVEMWLQAARRSYPYAARCKLYHVVRNPSALCPRPATPTPIFIFCCGP